jgi:hypothetical protein
LRLSRRPDTSRHLLSPGTSAAVRLQCLLPGRGRLLGSSPQGKYITERLQAASLGCMGAQRSIPGSCLGEVVSSLVIALLLAAKSAKCIQRQGPEAMILSV